MLTDVKKCARNVIAHEIRMRHSQLVYIEYSSNGGFIVDNKFSGKLDTNTVGLTVCANKQTKRSRAQRLSAVNEVTRDNFRGVSKFACGKNVGKGFLSATLGNRKL
ncbi:unnamed protein product [Ixodes pacificus]